MTGCAAALGMFDSVHIGHKAVIDAAIKNEYRSVILTFDKIPSKGEKHLLSQEEKKAKLLSLGVDEVYVLEFSKVKSLSPEEFLDFIVGKFNIKKICVGFNFRFGKGAVGDRRFLEEYCKRKEICFFCAEEVKSEGQTVSTTLIKSLLAEGKAERAAQLLGNPYSFTATVENGDKRGRTLGFPTVNQIYPDYKCDLKFGVYHTEVYLNGKRYNGVTNFGIRPTFLNGFVSAETHIIDYDGDCYGQEITLSFLEYLREERKFSSVDELKKEILSNVLYVKNKK